MTGDNVSEDKYIKMPKLVYPARDTRYINNTVGIDYLIPSPVIFADPTAASDYNAATISGIVFGIFSVLLTIYMIWQNGIKCGGADFLKSLIGFSVANEKIL